MSILEDDNILIESVKESVDFSTMLDSVLSEFKTTGSIFTESGEELFKKLPCFEEYEWRRFPDRFVMTHTTTRRTILIVYFNRILLYFSSKFNYEYTVKILMYIDYLPIDISDALKSLFKIDDELLWKCKYIKYDNGFLDEPHIDCKYIKTVYVE